VTTYEPPPYAKFLAADYLDPDDPVSVQPKPVADANAVEQPPVLERHCSHFNANFEEFRDGSAPA